VRRRAAGRCLNALSSVLVGWLAAFGAGARVSALTFDLAVQARALGGSLSLWLLLRAAVFVGGDLVVEQAQEATELASNLPRYASESQGRIKDLETALQARGIRLNLDSIRSQATSAGRQRRRRAGRPHGRHPGPGHLGLPADRCAHHPAERAAGRTPGGIAGCTSSCGRAPRVMGGYLRGQLTMSIPTPLSGNA
jgi:hypothetical protein